MRELAPKEATPGSEGRGLDRSNRKATASGAAIRESEAAKISMPWPIRHRTWRGADAEETGDAGQMWAHAGIVVATTKEQDPSPMHRRAFLAFAGATPFLAACTGAPEGLYGRLIILRHADRTFSMLNEAGEERIKHLPEALADLPVDAVYCTPRPRNIATATAIAEARGLRVNTMVADGVGTKLLRAHPGQTLVWVGNQENLGFLYAELRIPAKPPVQFGQIHVVTFPQGGGAPRVEKRHYGMG